MTPKEKAKHLFDLMYDSMTPNFGRYEISKRQASIVVDEIVSSVIITDLTVAENQFNYWEEVKQEIEEL